MSIVTRFYDVEGVAIQSLTTENMKSKTKTFSQGESYGDAMQFVMDQLIAKTVGLGPEENYVLVRKYKISVVELSKEPDPNETKE